MITALLTAALVTVIPAHDSWIGGSGYKNGAGEWCCGAGDCFIVPREQIGTYSAGYVLFGTERVPEAEAQPSPDGQFWRCRRPDGTRRCFFAPPRGV